MRVHYIIMSSDASEVESIMPNEVEFEYTGIEEQKDIPKDVTIVRIHSSVTTVSNDICLKDVND